MPRFTPRVRKQKARARLEHARYVARKGFFGAEVCRLRANTTFNFDTPQQNRLGRDDESDNVVELIPESKQARESRREQMRAEMRTNAAGSAMSSKKKKRLEKYIDSKLKKQDNLELIKKLGQQTVDTSLLRSSKRLGRVHDTKREALAQALNEMRRGINNPGNGVLLSTTMQQHKPSSSDDESPDFGEDGQFGDIPDPVDRNAIAPSPTAEQVASNTLGMGLKRPLEVDEEGIPIIQPRKRHKHESRKPRQTEASPELDEFASASHSDESSWAGFSAGGTDDEDDAEEDESLAEAEVISGEDDASNDGSDMTRRSSAFKVWAQGQRNTAAGFTPTSNNVESPSVAHRFSSQPAASLIANSSRRLTTITSTSTTVSKNDRKVYHVPIERPPEVEISRQDLPVVAKEQEIMETVFLNDVTILSGATGSGKTTQIPQFLLEAGYGDSGSSTPGMIGITQPRRVAAVSMAKRVAFEVGELRDKISYQIRFDTSVSSKTALKFMTDGVLLREISQDFTLSKYSVIIIDEAHERTVNTDILIGMLSRIIKTRRTLSEKEHSSFKPLKMIIMSATLRAAEFRDNEKLFPGEKPPVLDVEGRQYSVTNHFTRKTNRDYVDEIFQKLSRGHRKLPDGGMLVFLTGQNEIEYLQRRLKSAFQCTEEGEAARPKMRISAQQANVEDDDVNVDYDQQADTLQDEGTHAEDFVDDKAEDENEEFDIPDEGPLGAKRVHVLPLYSQLAADQQARVFEPPPMDSRLMILATNVAETSITIPNIRYVFDTGRCKVKQYNPATGVQTFAIDWISKASAQQRAGRAGRTGPGGHCYRLYSSAIYEDAFPAFTEPEITKTPVEGVILQLKSMDIPDITKFPFPTPLESGQLQRGERLLQYLGCLESGTNRVTGLGKQLSTYPISPRLARILVLAQQQPKMLEYALSLTAALGVPELFVTEAQLGLTLEMEHSLPTENGGKVWSHADAENATTRERLRHEYNSFHAQLSQSDKYSDGAKLLTALARFCALESNPNHPNHASHQRFIHSKTLREAVQLRGQLATIAAFHTSTVAPIAAPRAAPTSAQALVLRQLLAAGYIDNLAQRADLSPSASSTKRSVSSASQVPYITLFPSKQDGLSKAAVEELDKKNRERLEYVYVHAGSVLAHVSPQKLPRFVVYSHLSTANPTAVPGHVGSSLKIARTRMHPLSPVAAETVAELIRGTPLEGQGKPIGKIEQLPRNEEGEERRVIWSVPFVKSGSAVEGGREWPLPPARQLTQVRKGRRGWVEE